ncbi:OmpW family protein [Aquabacterium soli]|uniref:OmpW family protein n=1 Tax=Aquabacterium soli TaxID=2493092 RepID=A0A426V2P3_9BURK|nr:OmpW family protein [Aquabacterium soli]
MRIPRDLVFFGFACWAAAGTYAQTSVEKADELQLKPAQNMYWRIGYTTLKPSNKNGNATELGQRVVKYGDEFTPGLDPQYAQALQLLSSSMARDHPSDYENQGLGIPDGVTVKARQAGGFTVTMGRYLDDDRHWAIEAYVLGQPFDVSAQGAGRIGGQGSDAVNLGKVLSTKALGPIAYAKYIAGNKDAWFRPSIGIGGYYFLFFDTNASKSLEDYAGGRTSISIKNAYGPASFLGADIKMGDGWTLNATLGHIWLRTQAKAVTDADPSRTALSPALVQAARDIGPNTLTAIEIINGTKFNTQNLVPGVAGQLAAARSGDNQSPSLGRYTRSFDAKLNPWLLTVSVGRDF